MLAQEVIKQQKDVNKFLEWNRIKVLSKEEIMKEKKVELILKSVTKIQTSVQSQASVQDLEQLFKKFNQDLAKEFQDDISGQTLELIKEFKASSLAVNQEFQVLN